MKDSTAAELVEAATEAIHTVVLVGDRAVQGIRHRGQVPIAIVAGLGNAIQGVGEGREPVQRIVGEGRHRAAEDGLRGDPVTDIVFKAWADHQ